MNLLLIICGLVSSSVRAVVPKVEWRNEKSDNDTAYTRLLISSDRSTIYIGGRNQLLKLERNGETLQLISQRDISGVPNNVNPCCAGEKQCECCSGHPLFDPAAPDGTCKPADIADNIVQNLIEVDDFILYCGNVNEACALIPKDDLQISNFTLEQPGLVSPISENPALVSVLDITDSENVVHKVNTLYNTVYQLYTKCLKMFSNVSKCLEMSSKCLHSKP